MIVVIFEVTPVAGREAAYFDLAAMLKPELEAIDGFVSVERFESIATPGKYLSLSFWRDAEAVAAWRAHAGHQQAQARGKAGIFADFRIRVAEVMRDYTLDDVRSRA